MMKNEIVNFLWNEGDGNITLQGVTADNINITQVISFKELRDSFLLEKDKEIKILEEKLQLTLELLDSTKELNKLKIIELTSKVENAIIERSIAEKQLKHQIEKLSKTDLTKITGIQKQAFDFFFQKDIKNALLILDDNDLDEELEKAEELERQAKDAKKKNADARLFKASLLIITSDFDEAKKNFKKAINIFPSYSTHIEYALYLDDGGYLDEAQIEYEKALAQTNITFEIAEVSYLLGGLAGKQANFNASYKYLTNSLKLYETLSILDKNFLNHCAGVRQNLGSLYSGKYDFENANLYFQDSIDNWKQLLKVEPDNLKYLYGLTNVLHEYGLLNRKNGNNDIAINSYEEAIVIYRKLVYNKQFKFLPELASTLDTLIVAYVYRNKKNDLIKAENCYSESNTMWRNLSKFSQKYLFELSINLHNGGRIKVEQGKIEEAIDLYNECLTIRRSLIKQKMHVVETKSFMLKTLLNLGDLFDLKKDLIRAETCLTESLEISNQLILIDYDKFVLDLGLIKARLSKFYQDSKPNKELSIKYAIETIKSLNEFPSIPDSQMCLDLCYNVLHNWGFEFNNYWHDNVNWA